MKEIKIEVDETGEKIKVSGSPDLDAVSAARIFIRLAQKALSQIQVKEMPKNIAPDIVIPKVGIKGPIVGG